MSGGRDTVPLAVTREGRGRPVMVLHGGGGPASVAAISKHTAAYADTICPVIPGWNGTERPDSVSSVDDIAAAFLTYLDQQNLTDVAVIGSSVGGWIAADMAIRDRDAGRITGLVLVDAVGIEVPGQPIRDFFSLTPQEVFEYSFHDGSRFFVDPTTLPPEQVAVQQANMAAMKIVAGEPYMNDPTLMARLAEVRVPTLLIWGDSDRIVTPQYGEAYAKSFRDARIEIVRDAGHLPQIEQPAATFALIDAYLAADGRSSVTAATNQQ